MDSLFMALFFIFGIAFIVGMIKPLVFKRILKSYSNRKVISLIFVPLTIASVIIFTVFAKGIPYLDAVKSPTNQKALIISGTNAFNDSVVKIYFNSELKEEAKADNQGKFSFKSLELKEGENKLMVSSTNMEGRIRQSNEASVVLDTISPSLTIEAPQSPTERNKLDIKGSSEAKAEIVVIKNTKEIKKVKVKSNSFTIKGIALDKGENKFQIIARDKAGNQSESKDIAINYIPKEVPTKVKSIENKTQVPTETPSPKQTEQSKTQTSTPTNTPITALSYREVKSYQQTGQTWKMIVFSRKPTDDELKNAAREMHSKDKSSYFHLFDSDEKIQEYIDWDLNYGKVRDKDGQVKLPPDCKDISYCMNLVKNQDYAYKAPEDWMKQHELGLINEMGTSNGPQWQLSTPLGETITSL